MRLVAWQRLRRGRLVGYADIEMPFGRRFFGCGVFQKQNGECWGTPPSRPQVRDGHLARRDCDGKVAYEPTAEWVTPRLRTAFSRRLVELVQAVDPDAFTVQLDLEAVREPSLQLPLGEAP